MELNRLWLLLVLGITYLAAFACAPLVLPFEAPTMRIAMVVAPPVAFVLVWPLSALFGETIGNSVALFIGTMCGLGVAEPYSHAHFDQPEQVVAGAVACLGVLYLRHVFRRKPLAREETMSSRSSGE
jgi:hypothetical protein